VDALTEQTRMVENDRPVEQRDHNVLAATGERHQRRKLDQLKWSHMNTFPLQKANSLGGAVKSEAYSGQRYRSCETHPELQRSVVSQDR
jgi:hypothetical protein